MPPLSTSYGEKSRSTTQTSRFFTLPAEVCHEIYFLAFDIPRTPVTLRSFSSAPKAQTEQDGSRQRIQFEYFVDSPSGLELHQIKMSRFRICRQIYTEIMDLYFERSTWAFGNAKLLLDALDVIPMSMQSQIRSLAIWIEPGRIIWTEQLEEFRRSEPKQHTTCSIQELSVAALRLRSLQRLRVLQLYVNLATFRKRKNPDLSRHDIHVNENGQPHYDFSANEAIGLFVWDGMETRISLAEAELRELSVEGLWTDLSYCFGTTNIRWVRRSEDRYRGVMGDIVIKGERRKIPESSAESLLVGSVPLSKSASLPFS
jgi:hypothetical protein